VSVAGRARRVGALAWFLAIALSLVGCLGGAGSAAPTSGTPDGSAPISTGSVPLPSTTEVAFDDPNFVHVTNDATLTLRLFANGQLAVVVPPNTFNATAELTTLGPSPWSFELRTASGRTVLTLTAKTGGAANNFGPANRVDLSCGRIDLWVGPPLAGPAPGPGTPGDCAP
jgi:hypothetical protein